MSLLAAKQDSFQRTEPHNGLNKPIAQYLSWTYDMCRKDTVCLLGTNNTLFPQQQTIIITSVNAMIET